MRQIYSKSVEGNIQKRITPVLLAFLLVGALCYWFTVCHSKSFTLLFSIVVLFCILLFVLTYFTDGFSSKLLRYLSLEHHLFLIVLISMGLFFVFAFPPGSVPDEPHHFWSSYTLANVLTGYEVDYSEVKIEMRACDASIDFNLLKSINTESFQTVIQDFKLFDGSTESTMVSIPAEAMNFGSNPIYIKLPTALSIIVARLLNLGFYPLFYLGRIVSFTLFAISVIAAVRMTPIGKNGFRAVSLLPMTLHLCSSYSYDAGIICLSFLLIAALLRVIFDKNMDKVVFQGFTVKIAVLAILLAPCKVIYFAIFFLFFFVPNMRFGSRNKGIAIKISILVVGMLFIIFMRGSSIFGLASLPESDDPLDYRGIETGQFYTLGDALNKPLGTIILYLRTMDQLGDYFIQTFVGGSLGWLQENIRIPMFYVFAYICVVQFSFRRSDEEHLRIPFSLRVLSAIISVGIWIGAMTSMYLGWTFNTETLILGIQGRYLLPAAPLLFISLRSNKIRYSGSIFPIMVSGMVALNALMLMRTFALALVG